MLKSIESFVYGKKKGRACFTTDPTPQPASNDKTFIYFVYRIYKYLLGFKNIKNKYKTSYYK